MRRSELCRSEAKGEALYGRPAHCVRRGNDMDAGKSGHRVGVLLLPALVLLGSLVCRHAAAAVELREELSQDRTVYVITNGFLRAIVDPADGGAIGLSGAEGAPASGRAAALLGRDTVGGRLCRYHVAYQTGSEAVAVLALNWTDGSGLKVEKTISLLRASQVAVVNYVVENGSSRNERLNIGFQLERGGAREWDVRTCDQSGLLQRSVSSLSHGGEVLGQVRWFSVASPATQGVAVLAKTGSLSSALVWAAGEGTAIEMDGATAIVPSGRILKGELGLAPFEGLAEPSKVTEQFLCSVGVESAGNMARVNLGLLPLSDLGSGQVALRVANSALGTGETIPAVAREILCGKREALSFYWQPPAPGPYRAELILPGITDPVLLGRCTWENGALSFVPDTKQSVETLELTEVPGWASESPRGGQGQAPAFLGAQGAPLAGLQADVGVGERETLPMGFAAGGPGQTAQFRISDLIAARGVKRLPPSALRLACVLGPSRGESTDVPGLIVPVEGPPWGLNGLAALLLDTPDIEAATYNGQIECTPNSGLAALPLSVRVWPVRRPRPGFARMHLNVPLCSLWTDEAPGAPPCESLKEHEITNVALDLHDVLRPHFVLVRSESGDGVSLEEWLRREPQEAIVNPPALDFSPANPCLGRLLLSGLSDITVCGDLSLANLTLPGMPEKGQAPFAESFWRQFASHLREMGFRNLYFSARAPLGQADLTDGWLAAAGLMRRAGWSVCGPYDETVLQLMQDRGTPGGRGVVPGSLADLSRLVVCDGGLADSVPLIRSVLPVRAEVGLWVAGLPDSFSAEQGRRYAQRVTRSGADIVIFGSTVPPPGGTAASEEVAPTERRAAEVRHLSSLAWEGFRDGMDEVNYLRMLDWYKRRSDAGIRAEGGPGTARGLSKRQVLEELSLLGEKRAPVASVYWNDIALIARGEAAAVIAVDPDSPEQRAQAETLNQMIKTKGGVALPVLSIADLSSTPLQHLCILLGSPDTNSLVATLAAERPDLSWRLPKNGCMFVRLQRGATTYLALLTAKPAGWGDPLVRFNMMLWQEGGWVGQ